MESDPSPLAEVLYEATPARRLLAAAVSGVPSFAADTPSPAPRAILAADEPDDTAPPRDEIKRTEKKDPNDIRTALDNLAVVRDMKKLAKPIPAGLWQDYVNQPYYTPEQRAEKLLFCGQYEDSEKAYTTLLKKTDLKPEAIRKFQIGLLASILQQGHEADIERFHKKLETVEADVKDSPRVLSLRAQALVALGKNADAKALLKPFVTALTDFKPPKAEVLRIVNQYAALLERDAAYPAARDLYSRIVELEKENLPKDSELQTEIANAIYRQGVLGVDKERKRYALSRLGQICDADSTYWPAYLLSARILLESHNDREGSARLNDVLSRNPGNLEVIYLSLDNAIENYNFEGAEQILDDLKDRTDGPRILAAEGRLLLKKRTPEKALTPLLAAVKRDPALFEARGCLAATYYLLNDPAKAAAQLDATKIEDRRHPVAVFEAAEVLRDARQFPQAEVLYQQAQQSASWWSEPSSALAQLYLEIGDEDRAQKEYDRSFKIDPTNVRALNQLKLLEEHMKKFQTHTSAFYLDAEKTMPRVIVKCSPEDEVLARLVVEWMDKIYPEVTGYFQHQLKTPTIIELFPNHDQFGVRTTGLPWIGTVGASTGNVIAMDVPRGQAKNMMGTFDWARVLRHEFTHTVTLSMTNNRVPHWLTEAAACEQELSPRDWENCQMLASNYRAGTLFTLDTLTWGFIKPKSSKDRPLAYMESQWVYQFLVETYGQPKMLEFLRSFADGKTEAQAYKDIYGKPQDEVNKDFLVWAGKQIESWGLPKDPLPKQEELDKKLKANPDDPKALYDLAWMLASRADLAKAQATIEKVIKLDPKNTRARELLGAILNNMAAKDPDKRAQAKEILTQVVAEDDNRVVAYRTLGLIAMNEKNYAAAEKWFLKLQEKRPAEDTSYTKLAGIYLIRKENAKAIAQFAKLQEHEQHDATVPRQLAILYRLDGQLSEAESSAFRAVRINPYSAINHNLMAEILMAQRDKSTNEDQRRALAAKAAEYWKYATDLQPRSAAFWNGLALAHGESGNLAAASEAAKKAVVIQPNSPAGKWLKE